MLSFLLTACDTRGQMLRTAARVKAEMEPYFDHAQYAPATIHAAIVSEADFLAAPRDLEVIGNYLVVSDMYSQEAIHVFDGSSREYLGSFGRHGQGPGEFVAAPVLSAMPGADSVVVALDPSFRRVTRFHLPGGEVAPIDARDVVQIPTLFVYALEMVDERRAIGLGFFEEGRLGIFDLAAGTVSFAGAVPGNEADESFVRRQQAYQAYLAVNPARTRAVTATRLSTGVEIYDVSGELFAHAQTPYDFPVDYMVDQGGEFMPGWHNRFGYQSVTATDNLIYALFSGKAEAHFRGMSGAHAAFVHVFNWDGGLERVLRLDREVLDLAVDQAGATLYAITEKPQPAVLAFSLK